MAETHPKVSLLHTLDPISLILNQCSSPDHPISLSLTPSDDYYFMERGPRYQAYAELRDTKLRTRQQQAEPRKEVKFQNQTNSVSNHNGCYFGALSVSDFSAVSRKENWRPVNRLPSTPPSKSFVLSDSRGSKSATAGREKKKKVLMRRKSYVCFDESAKAEGIINGEIRARRTCRK